MATLDEWMDGPMVSVRCDGMDVHQLAWKKLQTNQKVLYIVVRCWRLVWFGALNPLFDALGGLSRINGYIGYLFSISLSCYLL